VRFRDAFSPAGSPRGASFFRSFSAVFALYFAVSAYRAGLHGNYLQFDANGVIAGVYVYSCGKTHSALKRWRRRRRYND
jgi:hypothetical protein